MAISQDRMQSSNPSILPQSDYDGILWYLAG
jgi:hypothetical protein